MNLPPPLNSKCCHPYLERTVSLEQRIAQFRRIYDPIMWMTPTALGTVFSHHEGAACFRRIWHQEEFVSLFNSIHFILGFWKRRLLAEELRRSDWANWKLSPREDCMETCGFGLVMSSSTFRNILSSFDAKLRCEILELKIKIPWERCFP